MARSLRFRGTKPEVPFEVNEPVARISRQSLSRSAIAAYSCICVALLLLLFSAVWGAYRDMDTLNTALLEAEIDRLRSHAERTVARIERDLEIGALANLAAIDQSSWLHDYWQRTIPESQRHLYAAIVDADGKLLLHRDPSHEGERLPSNWYDRVLTEIGDDVVETRDSVLVAGQRAYDLRMPIRYEGSEVGSYHAGFDVGWFEQWASEKQMSFLRRHILVIGGVLLVVLLATTSLYYIATHSIVLRRAVDAASIERATEVGKLAAGLAHEIRNPLHAIQLNLHSFRRVHQQQAEMPPEEISKMLDQSTREIGRIEQLMQELVGFATPDEPRHEVIDVVREIRDVVDFIQQEMIDRNVEINMQLEDQPVCVNIDRGRLRQIMLNLLQNAQQAMQDGGRIEIGLSRRRGRIEITVTDNGPGIPDADHERIFEPFYSTKSNGTGFGLALVKRFVEQVGGNICCENNAGGGVTMKIELHEAQGPPR